MGGGYDTILVTISSGQWKRSSSGLDGLYCTSVRNTESCKLCLPELGGADANPNPVFHPFVVLIPARQSKQLPLLCFQSSVPGTQANSGHPTATLEASYFFRATAESLPSNQHLMLCLGISWAIETGRQGFLPRPPTTPSAHQNEGAMGRLTNSGKEVPGFEIPLRLSLYEGYHRDTNSDVISLLCTLDPG